MKLGRKDRAFGANIPHLSAIVAGKPLPAPPDAVDYVSAMPQFPNKFGMMMNDKLGDCMCAAFYHARQVWTYHSTGSAQIPPDSDVELLYERACGYKRAEGGEGPGGNVQEVLTYVHKHGAPLGTGIVDRILGFIEVDPRNVDDVKRTIYHAGVAYLGLPLPQNIIPPGQAAPAIWDIGPGHQKIIGGHAVAAAGYDAAHLTIISWGATYKMTWPFFAKYVDEAYVIADKAWHDSAIAKARNLMLPGGLSHEQLADQMRFL